MRFFKTGWAIKGFTFPFSVSSLISDFFQNCYFFWRSACCKSQEEGIKTENQNQKMMRKPGVGGIQHRQATAQAFRATGEKVNEDSLAVLRTQMAEFKTRLEAFAQKHRQQINKNPEFRHQFHQMCLNIGVDPLASKKGFWSELLGCNDFWYEVAVQAIEVCIASRNANGGLMPLEQVTNAIIKKRGSGKAKVTDQDVEQAIAKVSVLGEGFRIITLDSDEGLSGVAGAAGGGRTPPVSPTITTNTSSTKRRGRGGIKMVQSVPFELTADTTKVLSTAQASICTMEIGLEDGAKIEVVQCCLSAEQLTVALNWTFERAHSALHALLQSGIAWIDVAPTTTTRTSSEPSSLTVSNNKGPFYWFLGLCQPV